MREHVRVRRALILMVLVLAGLPAPASAAELLECPGHARARLADGQERARRVLAPEGAERLRVCVYPESGRLRGEGPIVVRRSPIQDLTRRLNALRPARAGRARCPYDWGPTYVLVLGYERGKELGVRVTSFGCRSAANRYLRRVLPRSGSGRALEEKLVALAVSPSVRSSGSLCRKGDDRRVLARSNQAVLLMDARRRVVGCPSATGRRQVLARRAEIGNLRLAGSHVAYTVARRRSCELLKRDLETYEPLPAFEVGHWPDGTEVGLCNGHASIRLVLSPLGGIAWTFREDTRLPVPQPGGPVWGPTRVYRCPSPCRQGYRRGLLPGAHSDTAHLDRGLDVDPRSLRLRGDRISWTRGGRRQVADLDREGRGLHRSRWAREKQPTSSGRP